MLAHIDSFPLVCAQQVKKTTQFSKVMSAYCKKVRRSQTQQTGSNSGRKQA